MPIHLSDFHVSLLQKPNTLYPNYVIMMYSLISSAFAIIPTARLECSVLCIQYYLGQYCIQNLILFASKQIETCSLKIDQLCLLPAGIQRPSLQLATEHRGRRDVHQKSVPESRPAVQRSQKTAAESAGQGHRPHGVWTGLRESCEFISSLSLSPEDYPLPLLLPPHRKKISPAILSTAPTSRLQPNYSITQLWLMPSSGTLLR